MDQCQEYDATNGYNYQHFFKVTDLKNVRHDDNELLRMNLVVLGSKDAIILMSPNDGNDPNTPVYEIGKSLRMN